MAWRGDKYGHSLASKGIRTRNMMKDLPQKSTKEDILHAVDYLMDCDNVPDHLKNNFDEYEAICSLEIDEVIYYSMRNVNTFEVLVDGKVAGVKDIYWIEIWHDQGSYHFPPDGDIQWLPANDEISRIKNVLTMNLSPENREKFQERLKAYTDAINEYELREEMK